MTIMYRGDVVEVIDTEIYNSFPFTQDQAMIKKAECLMDTQRKSKKRVLGEEVGSGFLESAIIS